MKLPLVLVFIFLFSSAIAATKGIIHGTIVNEAGKPLKGVGIKLKLGANTLNYANTDDMGRFRFENLCEGSYKVVVSGFLISYSSRTFQNVDVSKDEAIDMNLILTPMKEQNGAISTKKNTILMADEYEDWSDIGISNKK